jgi:hypothetical protein
MNMVILCSFELLVHIKSVTRCLNRRNWGQSIPLKQWCPETRLYFINPNWIIGPHFQYVRIHRIFRRNNGELKIDYMSKTLTTDNRSVTLSTSEYESNNLWLLAFKSVSSPCLCLGFKRCGSCEEFRFYQEVIIHSCDNRCLSFVSKL